jgi:hypothetical protein
VECGCKKQLSMTLTGIHTHGHRNGICVDFSIDF